MSLFSTVQFSARFKFDILLYFYLVLFLFSLLRILHILHIHVFIDIFPVKIITYVKMPRKSYANMETLVMLNG